LNTLVIGKNFVQLPSAESTNSYLSALLDTGLFEGFTVFTSTQTKGRGQQGAEWFTEPGKNIACSVLLKPKFLHAQQVFLLNKMVAIAIRRAIQAWLPEQETLIKWPNDILVDQKKICGILVETQIHGDHVQHAVVGFGINVNQTEFEAKHGRATSLKLLSGKNHDLMAVLESVLVSLDQNYMALRAGKTETIEREYLSHLYAYQTETQFSVGEQTITGILVGVDPHGRLAVQVDGGLRYFGVKEIQFCL